MATNQAQYMAKNDLRPYYLAGIGVVGLKLGVGIKTLSLRKKRGICTGASLEPFRKLYKLNVYIDEYRVLQLEEYVTTCLAGSAARYIRLDDLRVSIKKSLGNAGIELKELRQMWKCSEPETDRAFALVFGSFGQIDDGDSEATLLRLWRRAIRILRAPKQYSQLNQLARQLIHVKEMSGDDVAEFLKG